MPPHTRKRVGRPPDPELAVRRREEILRSAGKVFAARGYPKTDVQVVANELNIGNS